MFETSDSEYVMLDSASHDSAGEFEQQGWLGWKALLQTTELVSVRYFCKLEVDRHFMLESLESEVDA